MSRKTFFKINWKEIVILLLVDSVIAFLFFSSLSSRCMIPHFCLNGGPCPAVTPEYCALQLFLTFQSVVYLFLIVLAANFALSAFWHFVVKK